MGLAWLFLSPLVFQGADFLETPEVKRYAQQLVSTKNYDVACSSTRPTGGGRIWKRGSDLRVQVGDKVYEGPKGGWLLKDLLVGRNRRLEWYEDVPLVELLMMIPLRGEPANPPPRAFRMTREVPHEGATVVEVGYRLADTHVDVRTTIDYWFSPVNGMLQEIIWRSEGMTQPGLNSIRLEWNLIPSRDLPPTEVIEPTSGFGRYEILPRAKDREAYVRVLLPQGVTAELEALSGETRVTAQSNRLDVRGTPGTTGGVFVAGRGLAVRFHSRTRLIIVCGAVENSGRKTVIVGGSRIDPGHSVAFFPSEYPVEGRARPVLVKPGQVSVLK